jgi:hypothetical protein
MRTNLYDNSLAADDIRSADEGLQVEIAGRESAFL